MSSNNYSYPHPILGNYHDIEPGLSEKCVVGDTTTDDDFHYYRFVMTIEDETILNLIVQEKAQYAIHYKCKTTRYEGCVCSPNNTIIVKIPRKDVFGKIDFRLSIIASKSFVYSNPCADQLFMGCSFNIHPNDPLVIFPDQWDILDLTYKTLKHYSSIIVPVPDDNVDENDVLINIKEKIEIHISTKSYENLRKINKPEYTEEVLSSYVQSALLTALFELVYESDKDIDKILDNDQAWVQAVLSRMRNEPHLPTLDDVIDSPSEVIPSLVQKLLQFPMSSLLNKLSNDVDTDSEDDNTEE